MVATKFVNGEEALRHFMAQGHCEVDIDGYEYKDVQKIWTGQIMGVYNYIPDRMSPVVLAKIKVVDIGYNSSGAYVKLHNLVTGQTQDIRYIPQRLFGYDIGVCMPNRLLIERTIQQRSDGTTSYGTRSGLLVMHRNDPSSNVTGMDIVESWYQLRNRFEHSSAFDTEMRNLQRKVCI